MLGPGWECQPNVPPGAILFDHVDVGRTLGVDAGLPVGRERLGLDALERSYREVGALNADQRRRQCGCADGENDEPREQVQSSVRASSCSPPSARCPLDEGHRARTDDA